MSDKTTQIKTLDDLTPEIKARIPMWKDKCTVDLYSGKEYAEHKREDTVEYMNYVYQLCNRTAPLVIVANTLNEYRRYFNIIFNEKINGEFDKLVTSFMDGKKTDEEVANKALEIETRVKELAFNEKTKFFKDNKETIVESPRYHWISITSEYSRVYLTWYKFIKDEFDLPCSKAEELDKLYDMVFKASIAKVFVCESITLVLRMPSKIHRNEIGLHNTKDALGAIQYPGEALHYINGRKMPDWVFEDYFSKKLKFKHFVDETDEDVKAGIITIIKDNEGNEGLMKFLNAKMIDEKEIVHSNGHNEIVRLYKTKEKYSILQDHNGNTNVPYAWTYMKCPSTGTEYLIDTSAAFDNVIDALKFHRPEGIPTTLDYVWQSFTN